MRAETWLRSRFLVGTLQVGVPISEPHQAVWGQASQECQGVPQAGNCRAPQAWLNISSLLLAYAFYTSACASFFLASQAKRD